jgi:hypothetical protein
MSMDKISTTGGFLIPGVAEHMCNEMQREGNLAGLGMFQKVKLYRNGVYVGVALSILSTLGALLPQVRVPAGVAYGALLGSLTLSVCATKALYSQISELLDLCAAAQERGAAHSGSQPAFASGES